MTNNIGLLPFLLLLFLPTEVFADDDILYLKCQYYSMHTIHLENKGERFILLKVDLKEHEIKYEDFYPGGSHKEKYILQGVTKEEIFGSISEPWGERYLIVDRISGVWKEHVPVKPEDKKSVLMEDGTIGAPKDEPVWISFGGTCEKVEQAF